MQTAMNPATGQPLRELPALDHSTLENVTARAYEQWLSWRKRSFGERARLLNAVAGVLRERRETLAPLMTEEMGKPIKEALGEVDKAAWCAEHYAEHAESYLAPETMASDASRSYVQFLPLGPVLGILPWNAPFWLAFRFCAPALMAGNTCLMKHDFHVPACAQAIADVFREAGAPEGLLQNAAMDHDGIATTIQDPRVRGVSFTGSTRAGAIVAAEAGRQIKPIVLELGGSDPCIILEDADLEEAARVATVSRIINAGQSCIAAKRIIVEDSVYEEILPLFQSRLEALKMGDPSLEETDIGPLAREDLRDNLHRQVRETIEQGANCHLGGELPEGPGFFYPPTLLADVEPGMTAAREETFGPVMVVMRARDEEHALALANDTSYGLGAAIWTSTDRGEALASQIEAGQVSVNGIVKTDPRLPSGGIKNSGIGRELGPHGIREFVNAQQVWVG